jgi:hypothetical protein
MAAPIGNRFWELAPTTGRKPMYSSPIEFEKDCFEYFEKTASRTDWNKQNWVGRDGVEVDVKVHPPFTKTGLCVFLGMSLNTFQKYKQKKDFVNVINAIEEIIYTQKFEGAATGHYNSNIIARDLGLTDKREIEEVKIKVTKKKSD